MNRLETQLAIEQRLAREQLAHRKNERPPNRHGNPRAERRQNERRKNDRGNRLFRFGANVTAKDLGADVRARRSGNDRRDGNDRRRNGNARRN